MESGVLGDPTHYQCWGHPTLCGMGGKSELKVHTIWVFSNFYFRACNYAFWLRRPPIYSIVVINQFNSERYILIQNEICKCPAMPIGPRATHMKVSWLKLCFQSMTPPLIEGGLKSTTPHLLVAPLVIINGTPLKMVWTHVWNSHISSSTETAWSLKVRPSLNNFYEGLTVCCLPDLALRYY